MDFSASLRAEEQTGAAFLTVSISTFPHGQSPPAGGWLVPVLGGNISCSQGKGGWGWCSGGGQEANPLPQDLGSDSDAEQQPREEKQPTTDTSPESLPSSPCCSPSSWVPVQELQHSSQLLRENTSLHTAHTCMEWLCQHH